MKNKTSESADRLALFVFLGAVVGGGIFGLPYIIAKAGIIASLFFFLLLGGGVTLLHLCLGEVILRTKENQRLVGYAQRYLGQWGKVLLSVSAIIGTIGVLLAYIIAGGDFLRIILSPILNLEDVFFNLIFFAGCLSFLLFGAKVVSRVEVLSNLLFLAALLLILTLCLVRFDLGNITISNKNQFFLPYGVILFALAGWSAVPEMADILKKAQRSSQLKRTIIIGTAIALGAYILFGLVISGVSGEKTSQEAFEGLIPFLGRKVVFWGAVAGAITLADSFLVIGLYLTNTLLYDFKIKKTWSLGLACGLPLILFLIGMRSFIDIIGTVGIVLGTIEGVIIVLMFKKAKKKGERKPEYDLKIPSFVLYLLVIIFLLGGAIHLIYLIK